MKTVAAGMKHLVIILIATSTAAAGIKKDWSVNIGAKADNLQLEVSIGADGSVFVVKATSNGDSWMVRKGFWISSDGTLLHSFEFNIISDDILELSNSRLVYASKETITQVPGGMRTKVLTFCPSENGIVMNSTTFESQQLARPQKSMEPPAGVFFLLNSAGILTRFSTIEGPVLSSPVVSKDQLSVRIENIGSDEQFRVEKSTNLIDWNAAAIISAEDPEVRLPKPTEPKLFFRAKAE